MQVQIERSIAGLSTIGVTAEPARWWDDQQRGNVLHQFGQIAEGTVNLAHRQGMKVVTTLLLSQPCNRSAAQLWLRKWMIGALRRLPTGGQSSVWASCAACDHIIVGLEAEKRVVVENYRVAPEKISTVPLGLSENFLKAAPASRDGNYLITVGTIAPVKRSLELARLAKQAQVPVKFVGKPFAADNDYWKEFSKLVDGKWVLHQPHVSSEEELIQLYRAARGFVLTSHYENWSFAAHEAAACGLPLLLMDLPWSRERFGNQAKYFPRVWNENSFVPIFKSFYEQARNAPAPRIQLWSWLQVAEQLKRVYEAVV